MAEEPSIQTSICFDDLYELLDAIMLFGAMIEPCSTGSRGRRLVVARTMLHLRPLYFALTLLHRHGIEARLTTGGGGVDKMAYTSRVSIWYTKAFSRWYPGYEQTGRRRAQVPDSISLTQPMAAVWMVDAMAVHKRGPLRLAAPRMSLAVAERLSVQLRAMGFDASVDTPSSSGYSSILIPAAQVPAVEKWLDERWNVPSAVWRD